MAGDIQNTSARSREDKQGEILAGCCFILAALISAGLSFGHALIGICLFIFIYPSVGFGYLWFRGKQSFRNFGDFVVDTVSFGLYSLFAIPAVLLGLFAIQGLFTPHERGLGVILGIVDIGYCMIAFRIVRLGFRATRWTAKHLRIWIRRKLKPRPSTATPS